MPSLVPFGAVSARDEGEIAFEGEGKLAVDDGKTSDKYESALSQSGPKVNNFFPINRHTVRTFLFTS